MPGENRLEAFLKGQRYSNRKTRPSCSGDCARRRLGVPALEIPRRRSIVQRLVCTLQVIGDLRRHDAVCQHVEIWHGGAVSA